jgi:hypothetical protein
VIDVYDQAGNVIETTLHVSDAVGNGTTCTATLHVKQHAPIVSDYRGSEPQH